MTKKWEPLYQECDRFTIDLIKGIDNIIREKWPHLEMYWTANGWIRKQRYE